MTIVSKDFICLITTTIDFTIKLGSISASVIQGGGEGRYIYYFKSRVTTFKFKYCFLFCRHGSYNRKESRNQVCIDKDIVNR